MDSVETEPVLSVVTEKKPSSGNGLWILFVVFYLMFCLAVVGVGGWLSYIIFQAEVEKNSAPYATATALAQWPVIFREEFARVSDTWYVGSYSEDGYTDTRSIANGEYRWELKSADGYTFWQPANLDVRDFVLSVDVRHTAGSDYDGYGVIFRNVAENYYVFSIQDRGMYTVYMYIGGRWNEIIAPTRSDAILPGQVNHLTVQGQAGHFQLFVNDRYLTEFDDNTLPNGDIGLMLNPNTSSGNPATKQPQGVRLSLTDPAASAVYDNLVVRAPQPSMSGGSGNGSSLSPILTRIDPVPGRLVFVSDEGGNRNIYTINTDGSSLKQLTTSPAADYMPRWSPDGKRIAFVSRRDGNGEIYVMDANGEHLTRLTDHPAEDISPDWSPDGKQIIFASGRNGNFDIYLMPADGEQAGLGQVTKEKYDEINPSISPDGSEILYQAKKKTVYWVMIMSITGKGGKEIGTYYGDRTNADAVWSPDGLKVAFVEKSAFTRGLIVVKEAHKAFGESFELTPDLGTCQYPGWAPGGEQLVFVSNMHGQSDVYLIQADGSGIFRVTRTEAVEESPDWTNP